MIREKIINFNFVPYLRVEDTNCNFKEVELKPISLDDRPEEERKDMILKFCQDKIDNEILPKYAYRAITPEIIEEVKADVSKIFNELKCDVKQNCENLEIEFIE